MLIKRVTFTLSSHPYHSSLCRSSRRSTQSRCKSLLVSYHWCIHVHRRMSLINLSLFLQQRTSQLISKAYHLRLPKTHELLHSSRDQCLLMPTPGHVAGIQPKLVYLQEALDHLHSLSLSCF